MMRRWGRVVMVMKMTEGGDEGVDVCLHGSKDTQRHAKGAKRGRKSERAEDRRLTA
jgi:hypothetical protein